MQTTVYLGLDKLPQKVIDQLDRAGVAGSSGTVVVTENDANGDELTTIYSAKPLLPSRIKQEEEETFNLEDAYTLLRTEKIQINHDHDEIKRYQLQLNSPDVIEDHGRFQELKNMIISRKAALILREKAQCERRKALKMKQRHSEGNTAQKQPTKKAKRPLHERRQPVSPSLAQQPLPAYNFAAFFTSPPPTGQAALPSTGDRPNGLSGYSENFVPSLPDSHVKFGNHPMAPGEPRPAPWLHSIPPYRQPSPGPAGDASMFAAPQPPPNAPLSIPSIHPDRMTNFGQPSREMQHTATFPSIPSFLDALGPLRSGANVEPVANRRNALQDIQANKSLMQKIQQKDWRSKADGTAQLERNSTQAPKKTETGHAVGLAGQYIIDRDPLEMGAYIKSEYSDPEPSSVLNQMGTTQSSVGGISDSSWRPLGNKDDVVNQSQAPTYVPNLTLPMRVEMG